MKIAVLGIDLGKNVCSVVGLDSSGAVVLRRRVRRDTLIDLVAKLPSCIVGMEACCGAHHLGRLFAAQGHDVSADVTRVCPSLCQGTEERRS
jgi:transposase